jgi:hypothetical protein
MGIIDEIGNRLTYRIVMDGEFYIPCSSFAASSCSVADLPPAWKSRWMTKTVTLDFIAGLIDFEVYCSV